MQLILLTLHTAWLGYLHIIRLISRRWIFKSTGNEVLNTGPSNHDTYANKGDRNPMLVITRQTDSKVGRNGQDNSCTCFRIKREHRLGFRLKTKNYAALHQSSF
jgi:hypothetical protein